MLVNAASQNHFKADRFDQSPVGSFDSLAPLPKTSRRSYHHRRTVSCLAVASFHEHYDHPIYLTSGSGKDIFDAIIPEGSASPASQTRHVQLQKSLSGAGISNMNMSAADANNNDADSTVTNSLSGGPLSGKLVKLNVTSPVGSRRSLLSDLLNSQAAPSRLEQNANRRRMLKNMRRYSVDASEMDFTLGGVRPSSRVSPMKTISSEGEALLIDGQAHQGFNATPTVRYLRNPCHAAVKTKLMPSAYRGSLVRRSSNGNNEDEEHPDYFATEDRVW
ncbi:hypothetical protein FBU30_010835 [Linnemannia zychae]|nr:hypothetical protein FBU30_010835 [Linnemannia zychae]